MGKALKTYAMCVHRVHGGIFKCCWNVSMKVELEMQTRRR